MPWLGDGARFTNFYTHASCSPTRATLLTGTDTHRNGLGNMDEWTAPNQVGLPGYQGYLNDQRRHAAGTAPGRRLSHVHGRQVAPGQGAGQDPGGARVRARLQPARRGGQLLGHDELHRDHAPVDVHRGWAPPHGAAQGLLRHQDLHRQDDRLHRREPWRWSGPSSPMSRTRRRTTRTTFRTDWRDRHVGDYDQGWDAVRQQRLARQVELGIMPEGTELAERMWFLPDPLVVLAPGPRAIVGRKMEPYAGLVENLDSPHRPARPAPQGHRRVRQHDLHRLRGQRRRGDRPLRDDCRQARHADYLYAAMKWSQTDPSLGRPGLVRRPTAHRGRRSR